MAHKRNTEKSRREITGEYYRVSQKLIKVRWQR